MSKQVMPRPMVLEEFAPHLHKVFRAECTPDDVDITLVEAKLIANHARLERHPFILIFHSAPAILLTTGIYQIRCHGLLPAAVYLEPTQPPPGAGSGYYYQAVFN